MRPRATGRLFDFHRKIGPRITVSKLRSIIIEQCIAICGGVFGILTRVIEPFPASIHPLRSRHHIGLRRRFYEISQRDPDLLRRVFLKEVCPLDSDFGLVRPGPTEFEYAPLMTSPGSPAVSSFESELRVIAVPVFFDDCCDVGGFAFKRRWRHLNFFQYRCELVAKVPRTWCRNDGVYQVRDAAKRFHFLARINGGGSGKPSSPSLGSDVSHSDSKRCAEQRRSSNTEGGSLLVVVSPLGAACRCRVSDTRIYST